MISRTMISSRRTSQSASVLGVLACVAAAFALGATPAVAASACPNEQLRRESNANPVTGQPYSVGLSDCRAYEMVSPLFKQGYDALPVNPEGLMVAPDGETVGFRSEGDFAEPENFNQVGFHAQNRYISRRGVSGWITSSAMAPADLRTGLSTTGFDSDFSPDLRSVQVRLRSGRTEQNATCIHGSRVRLAQRERFVGVHPGLHHPRQYRYWHRIPGWIL